MHIRYFSGGTISAVDTTCVIQESLGSARLVPFFRARRKDCESGDSKVAYRYSPGAFTSTNSATGAQPINLADLKRGTFWSLPPPSFERILFGPDRPDHEVDFGLNFSSK